MSDITPGVPQADSIFEEGWQTVAPDRQHMVSLGVEKLRRLTDTVKACRTAGFVLMGLLIALTTSYYTSDTFTQHQTAIGQLSLGTVCVITFVVMAITIYRASRDKMATGYWLMISGVACIVTAGLICLVAFVPK